MRYVIIDNSTLTATQRLLGKIEIKNKSIIDGDLLAFENLVQAILFYDRIFCIADYKKKFQTERKKLFSYIEWLEPNEIQYESIVKISKDAVKDIIPLVEGGQFKDSDFKQFFDLLNLNITFTWDLTSSKYFLYLKMLRRDESDNLPKFGALSSAIISQLSNNHTKDIDINSNPILLDSDKKNISKDYEILDQSGNLRKTSISRQAELFFTSLSWMALRTYIYSLVAKEIHADLILHPIRSAFQANMMSKIGNFDPSTYKPILDSIAGKAKKTLIDIRQFSDPIAVNMSVPIFSSWLVEKTKDPQKIIEEAYEIRKHVDFVNARNRFIDMQKIVEDEKDFGKFNKEANKISMELDSISKQLQQKYSLSSSQGHLTSLMIPVWNLIASFNSLPNIPDSGEWVSKIVNGLPLKKSFNHLYRSVVSDLANIEKLGHTFDLLTSSVRISRENAMKGSGIKVEEIKYYGKKSSWKIPM